MMINSITSGIDPSALAKSVADAERIPTIKRLDARQADYTVELSALGQYRSYLSDMKSKVPSWTDSTTAEDQTKSVEAFVAAYNKDIVGIAGLSSYNSSTKISGALQGDSLIRRTTNQVRQLAQFSEFGVSTQRDGTLSIDSTKLTAALASADSRDALANKFKDFSTAIDGMVKDRSALSTKINGVNSSIAAIDQEKAKVNERILRKENQYFEQFTKLNNLAASFQSTSQFLTQQFKSLSIA
jgi:flagellar hook-associated protein 2